jgi:transposase
MSCWSTPAGTASSTRTGPTCTTLERRLHRRRRPVRRDPRPRLHRQRQDGPPLRAAVSRHHHRPTRRPATPKPRRVTRWIMTDPDNLDPKDADQIQTIIDRSPTIAALARHVRDFATMRRKRTGTDELPQWIKRIDDDRYPPHTASPAASTRTWSSPTDSAFPYTSGRVEGQVNRIKWSNARCTAGPNSTSSSPAASSPPSDPAR